MAVCTTCLQSGITASGHDCPGLGEIQLSRKLGHGLIVDNAPPRARIALAVLVDAKWGAALQGNDLVNIADQVLYQVTGYDPESAALIVDLVEDWRPVPTAKLSEADAGEIKSRWLERYGNPGTVNHEPIEGR
jgi:hypothetical protein